MTCQACRRRRELLLMLYARVVRGASIDVRPGWLGVGGKGTVSPPGWRGDRATAAYKRISNLRIRPKFTG
jgi:hypothetical protein